MTRMSIAFFVMLAAPALSAGDDAPKPKPRPDQKITLAGQGEFDKAKGDVRYRNRPDEREFDLDLDKVPLPTGTVLNVEVNGLRVGTVKVGLLHGANLKLRSKDGDKIPFIAVGTIVTVRNEQRQAVVTGRF
jgi:hypothetical protein